MKYFSCWNCLLYSYNKEESLSKQVLDMIPAYFADGEVHRSANFIRYALQNGSPGMQNTHVRSALYRAKQSDLLRCEGRGRYRLCRDGGGQSENTGKLLQRLKRASAALNWTVNILALSEKRNCLCFGNSADTEQDGRACGCS